MRADRFFIYLFTLILTITVSNTILNGDEGENDPGKLAYKVMQSADQLKKKGDVYEAGKIFLEAAMMYKRAIAGDPDNRGYRTNFKYCLGTRGYIQIQKGQDLLKQKKYSEAAKYFKWAEEAYKYALTELPDERNFRTNLEYAQYHGGTAYFESQLSTKGKAPELIIDGFSGNKLSLSDMRGKVVLLEFWTGWCPSCKKSMPVLQSLHKSLSPKGLEIIAVAMDRDKTWKKSGSEKKAIETSKAYGFKFGWGDTAVSHAYGNFNSVPTMVLIDKKGNLFMKVSYDDQTEENLGRLVRSLL